MVANGTARKNIVFVISNNCSSLDRNGMGNIDKKNL